MKKPALLIISFFAVAITQAQLLKQPIPKSNSFEDSLNKVVIDFANNFKNLQSTRLLAEIDADTYLSTICLPGAVHCTIMRYHSVVDNSASWQAVVYAGESYEEAVMAYKKIFGQVKKSKVRGIDNSSADFEGTIETADENVRFAVSSLRLKTADIRYTNFVADIELVNNYDGWEVHLNLYKKKKDTDGGNMD
jgi:hypothetical protein